MPCTTELFSCKGVWLGPAAWQQLRDRGLLGKTEPEIGPKAIQEIEREVEAMLRNAGFQPRR